MKTLQLRAAVPAAALMAIQLTGAALAQQQLDLPRPSPNASVSQMVGVTEITLRYSRPGVKGRKIWGDLVHHNLQGWVESPAQWSEERTRKDAAESRRRAEAMMAEPVRIDAGYGS